MQNKEELFNNEVGRKYSALTNKGQRVSSLVEPMQQILEKRQMSDI